MRIISANISGSLTLNGVDVTNVTVSSSIWSGSMSSRVTSLEQFSSSLDATFATDAQLAAATASLSASLALPIAALNSYTSSNNTTIASLNTFSGSILSYTSSNDAKISALNAQSASFLAYTSSNDATISALNSFSSSILSYTSSNNTNISSLQNATSSLQAFSASILAYTSSTDSKISSIHNATSSLQNATSSLQAFSSSILSYTSSANTKFAGLDVASGSAITRLNALEVASGSAINRLSSLETASGSAITRLISLENRTGSYATTGSNTFVGGQYFSSSFNPTGFTTTASLYTDGGLRVTRDAYISGTLYLNNVTVFGTQSVAYISSSQLNIGTNIISVNTDTPSVRFGGLAVYDSGSTGLTGSILWDSQNNHWVYTNPSGSSYSGGMFISGPRASSLGSETGTTSCALMMGQGGDHITSSAVFHYGNATCFYGTSFISSSGAACFAGSLTGAGAAFSGNVNVTVANTPEVLLTHSNTSKTFLMAVDGSNAFFRANSTNNILFQYAGGTTALNINGSTGVACFAGQICAPTVIASTCLSVRAGNATLVVNNIAGAASNNHFAIQRNDTQYASIGLNGSDNFTVFGTSTLCPRLTIDSSGISCFGGTVCAAGNLLLGGAGTANAVPQYTAAGVLGNSKMATYGAGGYNVNFGWSNCGRIGFDNDNTGTYFYGLELDNGTRRLNIIGKAPDGNSGVSIWTGTTSYDQRFNINASGIACFACQVCTPKLYACTTSDAAIVIDGYSKLSFADRGTEYGTINASRYNFGGESTLFTFQSSKCFLFLNGTNCLMFIGSNGNVGVGDSGPSSKLEVKGANTDQIRIAQDAGSTTKLHLGQFADASYIFNNYAFVGGHTTDDATKGSSGIILDPASIILQTAPASASPSRVTRLTISSTGISCFACQICTSFISANAIDVSNGGASTPINACVGYGMFGYSGVGLGLASGASGANQGIGFFVCGVERGRWITNGNLGIGTVCPSFPLDVTGTIRSTGTLIGNNGNISTSTICTIASTTLSSSRGIVIDANTTTNNAFVPIGFSWASSISSYDPTWGMAFKTINYNAGIADLAFYTAGNVRMTITNGGSVGIGTTGPAARLDVSGTVKISDGGRLLINQLLPLGIVFRNDELPDGDGSNAQVTDTQATNGNAKRRLSSASSNTFFYGPYTTIPAGTYIAYFRLKVTSNASGSTILYMDITNSVSTGIYISPNSFAASNRYQYFKIPFIVTDPTAVMEFRGLSFSSGITDIFLDHVMILPGS
jgi:hypothetical protein